MRHGKSMGATRSKLFRTGLSITTVVAGTIAIVASASLASASNSCPSGIFAVTTRAWTVTTPSGTVTHPTQLQPSTVGPGDTVTIDFTIAANCTTVPVPLASYNASRAIFNPSVDVQTLFDSATGLFSTGAHTLTIHTPLTSGVTAACPNPKNSNPNFSGNGANTSGAYNSTCDGSASGNGNGNGNATGKPCAGCVGAADNKNPPGQRPNGSDHNAGYECDRNHGIGRSNPAPTGCTTGSSTPPPSCSGGSMSAS